MPAFKNLWDHSQHFPPSKRQKTVDFHHSVRDYSIIPKFVKSEDVNTLARKKFHPLQNNKIWDNVTFGRIKQGLSPTSSEPGYSEKRFYNTLDIVRNIPTAQNADASGYDVVRRVNRTVTPLTPVASPSLNRYVAPDPFGRMSFVDPYLVGNNPGMHQGMANILGSANHNGKPVPIVPNFPTPPSSASSSRRTSVGSHKSIDSLSSIKPYPSVGNYVNIGFNVSHYSPYENRFKFASDEPSQPFTPIFKSETLSPIPIIPNGATPVIAEPKQPTPKQPTPPRRHSDSVLADKKTTFEFKPDDNAPDVVAPADQGVGVVRRASDTLGALAPYAVMGAQGLRAGGTTLLNTGATVVGGVAMGTLYGLGMAGKSAIPWITGGLRHLDQSARIFSEFMRRKYEEMPANFNQEPLALPPPPPKSAKRENRPVPPAKLPTVPAAPPPPPPPRPRQAQPSKPAGLSYDSFNFGPNGEIAKTYADLDWERISDYWDKFNMSPDIDKILSYLDFNSTLRALDSFHQMAKHRGQELRRGFGQVVTANAKDEEKTFKNVPRGLPAAEASALPPPPKAAEGLMDDDVSFEQKPEEKPEPEPEYDLHLQTFDWDKLGHHIYRYGLPSNLNAARDRFHPNERAEFDRMVNELFQWAMNLRADSVGLPPQAPEAPKTKMPQGGNSSGHVAESTPMDEVKKGMHTPTGKKTPPPPPSRPPPLTPEQEEVVKSMTPEQKVEYEGLNSVQSRIFHRAIQMSREGRMSEMSREDKRFVNSLRRINDNLWRMINDAQKEGLPAKRERLEKKRASESIAQTPAESKSSILSPRMQRAMDAVRRNKK